MNRLLVSSFVTAIGLSALAIEPQTDGAGNYVFSVASGTETCTTVLSGPGDVIKDGAGTLILTGVNTLTGTYRVNGGTLQMAATSHPGNGSTKPSLNVANGATFISDGPNSASEWTNLPFDTMTLSGKGVGDQGAFIRQNDTTGMSSVSTLKVVLLADTTINVKSHWNPGEVTLNGHQLTKIGAGELYGANKKFNAGTDGSIHIAEGSYISAGNPYNVDGGTTDNIFELSGGSLYNIIYSSMSVSKWLMKVSGAATLQATWGSQKESAVWGGPICIMGGDLKFTHAGNGQALVVQGPVTATNGYGIIAQTRGKTVFEDDVDLGSGALSTMNDWCDGMEFQKGFRAGSMILGRADGASQTLNFVFEGDSTVGNVALENGVVAEFQGNASLTGTVHAGNSTIRFKGGDRVTISKKIGGNEKDKVGHYEFADVNHIVHQADTYLNGASNNDSPTTVSLTNTVWNGGSSGFYIGYNFCRATLDLFDSVFTNAVWLGGSSEDQWSGSIGAMYQCGGDFYGPLQMGYHPGHYAYIKESGHFSNAANALRIGPNGFNSVYLLSGDNTLGASMTLSSDGNYAANGGTAYWQAGGSASVYYLKHTATGDRANTASTFVLDGQGTLFTVSKGQKYTVAARSDTAFKCVTALNGGATLATDGLSRDAAYPKCDGASTKWDVSFDGGVIHQTTAGEMFAKDNLTPDKVIVDRGGMGIDTTGCSGAVTVSVPLEAPIGKVVGSIDLPTDPAFKDQVYLTPVKVDILGKGEGAAAIAILDKARRTIKEIKVVARGTGYDDTTTAKISAAKFSHSAPTTFDCVVHLAEAPTAGEGLCKSGEGSVSLKSINTFHGPVRIKMGSVSFETAGSFPASSSLLFGDGASANFNNGYSALGQQVVASSLEVTGGAKIWGVSAKGLKVTGELALHSETNKSLYVNGALILADGAVISGIDVAKLDAERRNVICSTDDGIQFEGNVSFPKLPEGWKFMVRGNELCVRKQRGLALILR